MNCLKKITAVVLLLSLFVLSGCQQIKDIFNPTTPTETTIPATQEDSSAATEAPTQTEPTQQTTEPTTEPPQDSLKEGSSLVYTEDSGDPSNGTAVNISISLPQFTGANSQSINDYMKQRFESIKAEALSIKDSSDPLMGGGIEYEHEYKLEFSDKYINVIQTDYTYLAGAVHPMHNSYSDNFDALTGQRILLVDLFKDNSEYARVLAERSFDIMYADKNKYVNVGYYSREEIDANPSLRTEVKDACVAALSDNTFKVTEEGLTLIFNPYTIAPYAYGTIEVKIPWSDLKDIRK
ncbi:MAG: RsiV family protein [Patescibacteria group bacterium]|nr:RsiV family protein [Patescibacteria group bacterium]